MQSLQRLIIIRFMSTPSPQSPAAFTQPSLLRQALSALGELLAADDTGVSIIVVGGASLNMLGLLTRSTNDVDVLAFAEPRDGTSVILTPPEPLPPALVNGIRSVARDLQLPVDWMNTEVARQWRFGMPPDLADDLTWEMFAGLRVGLAGRQTLITLKLFAAVDTGHASVHMQDLCALRPSHDELTTAARWVATQDAAPEFPTLIADAIRHVISHA